MDGIRNRAWVENDGLLFLNIIATELDYFDPELVDGPTDARLQDDR